MRIFFAICFAVMASVPLHADGISLRIRLGLRDTKLLSVTNVAYPLAFQIENAGNTVVERRRIPGLFRKCVVHVRFEDGREQTPKDDAFGFWWSFVEDLKPGAVFEHPIVADLLTFFPPLKDGIHQAWWTLEDLISNTLRVTVADGKIQSVKQEPD